MTRRKNLTGSPFKKPLWVAAIVLFYAVFFADIFRLIPSSSPAPFGSGTMGLMFLFSAGSLLTAFSDSFAAYVLKKERKRTDVKTALLFIAVITGFISMIATLMVFA